MTEKHRNVVLWVLAGLSAAVFFGGGAGKIAGAQQMVDNFNKWGYGDGFRMFIGSAELVGGLGLLIPATATLAASGLSVIMVGAIFTHLSHGEPLPALVPLVLLGMLLTIARGRRSRVGRWLGASAASAEEPVEGH